MHEWLDSSDRPLVIADEELSREFEARLTESSTLAFRVAFSVVRHRQDAEDIAQEAFGRAWRSFRALRDRERFRAWLVRMTWRLALDWTRGSRRRAAREQAVVADEPPFGDAEVDAIANDRATRLWAAIDALPDKLRIVVVLASMEGHSLKDVAGLVGAPEGTVKSRLFEARKQLEARLR